MSIIFNNYSQNLQYFLQNARWLAFLSENENNDLFIKMNAQRLWKTGKVGNYALYHIAMQALIIIIYYDLMIVYSFSNKCFPESIVMYMCSGVIQYR